MCEICIREPGSHSFEFIRQENNINYYYTCPAKATKYWDTKGILNHYREVLNNNNNAPWIWIFDGSGFGLKHSLKIDTALGLIQLLKEDYGNSLIEIHIINPGIYIKSFYTLIHGFLNDNIVEKIKWHNY
tara:strand:+ start:419 stop:808 length:390 start_codon:yes stop_codon:yes gene_type:complete